MSGQDVHRVLAIAVAVIAVALALMTFAWGRLGRPGRLAVDRAILAALVAVLIAIVSGALLAIGGSRPADGLHLLYAGVALAVLPIVRFAGAFARRRALAVGVGAVVLALLVLRLAQTG